MKIKTALFAIWCGIWVLTAGLFLPRVANGIQDGRYAEKVERYETEAIVYDRLVAWGVTERLRNAGVSMVQAELKTEDPAEGEAISTAARQALEEMERCGVDGIRADTLMQTSLTPLVVAAKDRRQTADTDAFKTYDAWRCIFKDDSGNEIGLLLDSQSQKMIAALYLRSDETSIIQKQAEQSARRWAEFCAQYYGFTLSDIQQNQTSEEWQFELCFTDSAGEMLELPYSVGRKSFQFQ